MRAEITLVIADDHPIFRKGLREVIETDPQLKIVAEAENGETALALIEQFRPQVAILDLDMPQRDGFEVTRAIQEKRLPTEVIFLTMHNKEGFLNAALNAGVKGYVLKDSIITEIIQSIRTVVAGQNYISPALSTFLLNRRRRTERLAAEAPGVQDLTPTERKILALIAGDKTSKEIANQLCISPLTVETHRKHICTKLRLQGANALTKFALSHKSEL